MTTPQGATLSRQIQRCPACGQRLASPPPPRCPLCAFDFGDARVTSADRTPYADAYARQESGQRRMIAWCLAAGPERMKHLALMRASAASRRFARTNIALLALALGIMQATNVGWWSSGPAPAVRATDATLPAVGGWYHVAGAPRPLPLDLPAAAKVDLWWSLPQTLIGVGIAIVVGLLLGWAGLALLTAGVRWAHHRDYRSDQRMTAALQYSTAWAPLLFLAAAVGGLLPVGRAGVLADWSWYPSPDWVLWAAAAVAGLTIGAWWFWLIRLGATSPPRTRARVVTFFVLAVPLFVAAATAGWRFGLRPLREHLFDMLGITFGP